MQLEMEFFTYSFIVCLECSNPPTTPFLFSMCVLRDLPKQKNPRGGMLTTKWERPEEIKRELFT